MCGYAAMRNERRGGLGLKRTIEQSLQTKALVGSVGREKVVDSVVLAVLAVIVVDWGVCGG